ncbi:MAG TPA: hypothetical protein VG028_13390 [Terriglobia bacterium]|nr:hypothetical protein [Terriglobia bacterium]
MKQRAEKQTSERNQQFVRATVTIPAELAAFVETRKNDLAHAGSLSSYVRSLILQDRQSREKALAA